MMNQFETSFTPRNDTVNLVRDVVEKAYDSVVSTMGPNGELALIIDVNQPVVTKDGVRVAKALDFNDIRLNSIAKLITSAAIKTDDIVGDGTTTTVMMVRNLFNQFDGEMNFHTARILDELVDETKAYLTDLVKEVTPGDYRFNKMVRTTSNYQDDISETVIKLFKDYNAPNIVLKKGNGNAEDVIETNNRISFSGRYATPQLQFGTIRGMVNVENSLVVVINNDVREIDNSELIKLRDIIVNTQKPVYLFARSFDNQVHDALINLNNIINRTLQTQQQTLFIIPFTVHSPGSLAAETVNDLGKLLNVTPINNLEGMVTEIVEDSLLPPGESFSLDISGIYFDAESSPIVERRANEILERIQRVYEGMNFSEKASYMGKFMLTRISRLLAENVTIIVSGLTEAEITERYYLYEDAIKVAASSVRFGALPGIGWGYNQAAQYLYEKYQHLDTTPSESDRVMWVVVKKFTRALVGQYEHLSGVEYSFTAQNKYFDLVTLEWNDEPADVFDNGSSSIVALEGGWSVVKRLTKLSCILGKSNTSYRG